MKELFHPNCAELQLTSILYALSDPIRLEIVRKLGKYSELSCNEFNIAVAKSSLSHHFKVLRESGVTRVQINGTQRFISLRYEELSSRFPGLIDAIMNI